jgi:hypothetical protein
MAIPHVRELPGAPALAGFPDDTIAELVILGLSGDDSRPTAHVAVYVENAAQFVAWVTMMDFDAFLECMPSWSMVNLPNGPADIDPAPPPRAGRHGGARRSTRRRATGAELATAWRTRRRPARATEDYLLATLEFVPRGLAADYVDAYRRVRHRSFDRASRTLIADVCTALNAIAESTVDSGH